MEWVEFALLFFFFFPRAPKLGAKRCLPSFCTSRALEELYSKTSSRRILISRRIYESFRECSSIMMTAARG